MEVVVGVLFLVIRSDYSFLFKASIAERDHQSPPPPREENPESEETGLLIDREANELV